MAIAMHGKKFVSVNVFNPESVHAPNSYLLSASPTCFGAQQDVSVLLQDYCCKNAPTVALKNSASRMRLTITGETRVSGWPARYCSNIFSSAESGVAANRGRWCVSCNGNASLYGPARAIGIVR
jgi:hypothetical protein